MGWEAAPRVDWSAPMMLRWERVPASEVWPARAPTAAVRVRWWYRRHAGWIERADGVPPEAGGGRR